MRRGCGDSCQRLANQRSDGCQPIAKINIVILLWNWLKLIIFICLHTRVNSSFGPIPLNIKICGELTAPPATITSFLANIFIVWPRASTASTPCAFLELGLTSTLVTVVFSKTCRFGRSCTGRMNARDELMRIPFFDVVCAIMKPVELAPFKSLMSKPKQRSN